jgi:hypothetical protein
MTGSPTASRSSSPGPGSGVGISTGWRTSGGPKVKRPIARMRFLLVSGWVGSAHAELGTVGVGGDRGAVGGAGAGVASEAGGGKGDQQDRRPPGCGSGRDVGRRRTATQRCRRRGKRGTDSPGHGEVSTIQWLAGPSLSAKRTRSPLTSRKLTRMSVSTVFSSVRTHGVVLCDCRPATGPRHDTIVLFVFRRSTARAVRPASKGPALEVPGGPREDDGHGP